MSTATTLTFTHFVDLLLVRLYELEKELGPEKFFNLNAIAGQLREKVPTKWVFDAGKVIEARGLATCLFVMGGRVDAELTGEGRMFVEQRQEENRGIIGDYLRDPATFVVVSGQGHQADVGSPGATVSQSVREERRPAFELLDQVEEGIKAEQTLSPEEKKDLLVDLETIRRQLEKREPNRHVLASLLEPLSRVSSLAGPVANLITLINA